MAEPSPEAVKAAFRRRQNRQFIVTGLAIATVLLSFFLGGGLDLGKEGTTARWWLFASIPATVFPLLGFSFWNWRCPNCDGYLGRFLVQERCHSCGAEFA